MQEREGSGGEWGGRARGQQVFQNWWEMKENGGRNGCYTGNSEFTKIRQSKANHYPSVARFFQETAKT